MTAAPPHRRRKIYTFWWCFLGICAEALLFLLSALSDACELPPPFEAMELKGTPKPYYEVGEKIEYTCKKGYLYQFPFLMVATCEPNHTWVPISDDGCVKVKCSTLANPSFGNVHYIDGRVSWGARAHFMCVDGYYLVGTSVLHCVLKNESHAYWNGPPPRCEKIYCLPPPKIEHGTHTFTDIDVFKYQEAVIYSCDPSPGPDKFSLVGMPMLFCSGQNTWSSKPPECKVVKCPFPVLQNGRQKAGFAENFSYQATVTFECVEGFYMLGSSTVVCSANSTWEPSIPLCLKVLSCAGVILCWCHPVLVSSCVGVILCRCHPVPVSSCAGVILCRCYPVLVLSCAGVILCRCYPVLVLCYLTGFVSVKCKAVMNVLAHMPVRLYV
ncbi:membrane cofactor protein [Acomys russatus]|uniref:membrane cofactor protein n=1 Tax=Acomys russatus TaxID=60746 RepID=UPI0021E214A3|nr:membrane cofactor protein [Acomys russatus]